MTRVVRATMIEAAPNGARLEGVWNVELPDTPPRVIEVRVVPGTDKKSDPWRAAGACSIHPFLSGAGATPELALGALIESFRWRQVHGTAPQIAINRDPRLPDEPVTIQPLAR